MNTLNPTLTLAQLKQITKNTKNALKELGIELTNSTMLNVVSQGYGFKDYNTAKAALSKQEMREDINHNYPYGPFHFSTFLIDPMNQNLFDVHLPLMKGIIIEGDIDGALKKSDAKNYGISLAVDPSSDFLDAQPIIQIVFDLIKDTVIVNIDAYANQGDIIKLIHTYRKYGITRLVLTSRHAPSVEMQKECEKNNVEYRRERDIIFLLLLLRTEANDSIKHDRMTFVSIEEFTLLAERIGLSHLDAKYLALWYHELNGGWIEYKLLIKGVMFGEEDSLLDIQRVLYETFVYSIPNYNVGDKTKNDHWESYINKETCQRNVKKMFSEGIYFNKEISDAIGLDYDAGEILFMAERDRYRQKTA